MSDRKMLSETVYNLKQWLHYPQEFRISARKYIGLSEPLEAPADLAERTVASSQTTSEKEEELLDMANPTEASCYRRTPETAAKIVSRC